MRCITYCTVYFVHILVHIHMFMHVIIHIHARIRVRTNEGCAFSQGPFWGVFSIGCPSGCYCCSRQPLGRILPVGSSCSPRLTPAYVVIIVSKGRHRCPRLESRISTSGTAVNILEARAVQARAARFALRFIWLSIFVRPTL